MSTDPCTRPLVSFIMGDQTQPVKVFIKLESSNIFKKRFFSPKLINGYVSHSNLSQNFVIGGLSRPYFFLSNFKK